MPKMKPNKAAQKRFKKTGSGKIMRKQAFHNHLLRNKTKKRKLRLKKWTELQTPDYKRINQLLGEGR
jgi:large subunit ribosomal protein L35